MRSLHVRFAILVLAVTTGGCQNPTWNFDDFKVSGEFRLDGTCAVSLNDSLLGEGTYLDFQAGSGLPVPEGRQSSYWSSCDFGEYEYLILFLGYDSFRSETSHVLYPESGWPEQSTATMRYKGFEGNITAKEGVVHIREVQGGKLSASFQYTGKRHINYF